MKRLLVFCVQRGASIPGVRALLRLAVRLIAPRHYVGAVGAVVNQDGKVLLARHSYRTDFQWGLPGGWVERGEDPARTVEREIVEELNLNVAVERLLVCGRVPKLDRSIAPAHIGLAFLCRPIGQEVRTSHEITAVEWIDPLSIPYEIAPFQARAIAAVLEGTGRG